MSEATLPTSASPSGTAADDRDTYAGQLLAFKAWCDARELNFSLEMTALIRRRMGLPLAEMPIDRPLQRPHGRNDEESRRQRQREYMRELMAKETPEARERRLQRMREYTAARRRQQTTQPQGAK